MKKHYRHFAPALALVAGLSYQAPSYAVCDGCVVGAVKAAGAAITTSVTALGTGLTTAVVTATSTLTMTIKGAQSVMSQTTVEAAKMMAETQTRTIFAVERERQDSRYQVTDPCSVSAAAYGMSEALAAAAPTGSAFGRGGNRAVRAIGGSSAMARAIDQANGVLPTPSAEAQAIVAAKGACETFARGGQRGQACVQAGYSAGNSSGYEDADIKAETVLDGPQNPNAPRRRMTIDPGSNDSVALQAYVRNITSPLNLRSLDKAELASDDGRRYMAVKDTFDARMSLAERPLRRHIGQITASAATRPMLEELLKSKQGAFVRSYLDRQFPQWSSKGISPDELLNLEVQRRYMNLDWHARMAEASPEEVAREQLQLSAFQNVLLLALKDEMREGNVAMSGQISAQVRQEMVPQLMTMHRQVTKAH